VSTLAQAAAPAESGWRPWAARGVLAAQLRAAKRSARRLRQLAARRWELPEERSVPEAELGSTALPRAVGAIPKVLVLPPPAVRAALFPREVSPLQAASYPLAATGSAEMLDQARASAATARGHPAQSRVRPFQAFQDAAQAHLVLPAASAQQEPALPLEESAARDAVEAPQPAGPDVEEVPQQEVAVLDVAEGAQAAPGGAVVPQPAVAWVGAAVLPPEARDAAAVPLRGAVLRTVPDARVVEPRAAGPLEVPWVFRRDQALPWPAPQPAEWFARAMQGLQIALPSAQSWQAGGGEVVS